MMDKKIEKMKREYKAIPIPEQLKDIVENSIKQAKEEKGEEIMKQTEERKQKLGVTLILKRTALTAAAVLATITVMANSNADMAHAMGKIPILGEITKIVTFRTYESQDKNMEADVKVPQIVVDDKNSVEFKDVTNILNKTVEEYTNEIIAQYEADVKETNGENHESIQTDYEVVRDDDTLFSLRINTNIAVGSSDSFIKLYHIDKQTGKMITLKNLFKENSEYITVISDNIKEQMRTKMKEDDNKAYFLDSGMENMDFEQIKEDQNFYLSKEGKLTVVFDKYEAAPGYMGVVEFVIPSESLKDIAADSYLK